MFTSEEIAKHCDGRVIKRALAIARQPSSMSSKKCTYSPRGSFTISAYVLSASGWADRYSTEVDISKEGDRIRAYDCTCPAARKYEGMCKHEAALALAFLVDPHSFAGYEVNPVAKTDAALAAFMGRIQQKNSFDKVAPGSISLEPTFHYEFGTWSVSFKVSNGKTSYVLKNIPEFLEAVHKKEYVEYGKKLKFVHSMDVFDEQTKRVIDLLYRLVTARTHLLRGGWAMMGHSLNRSVDLSDAEVIDLFDALSPGPIKVDCSDASLRQRSSVPVVNENPAISVMVDELDDGSYTLQLDEIPVYVAEGKRMYVARDEALYNCTPEFAECEGFFHLFQQALYPVLTIASEDAPLFCATILPLVEGNLQVKMPHEFEQLRPLPLAIEFYFDRVDDTIELEAKAKYGEFTYALAQDTNVDEGWAPLRQLDEEKRALTVVREFFPEESNNVLPLDAAKAAELLFGGLALFREVGEVFTTPAFDRLIIDRPPRMQLGLSLVGNLINLDVSSDDVDPAELAALLGSYQRKKKYHRLKSGAYANLEDMQLKQLDRLMDDLNISPAALAKGQVELPAYRALFLDEAFDAEESYETFRSEAFITYVERLRSLDLNHYEVPASLEGVLRPYQKQGFSWLSSLVDLGFGGILADEMGLGKSIQLISLLLARAQEAREVGPSLIVCPASLVYNWLAEFATFAPEMKVRALEGDKRNRARILHESGVEVLVASYDLVRIDEAALSCVPWYACVLDEAQYIKNHTTLTTRAVKRLHAQHKLALTGTPIENRLSEVWSIFDFLMPGFFGSYARFRERYELGILGGDEELTHRLQSMVGPFIMRRVKEDVLPDLPDKIEQVVYVPLEGEQRKLYAAHEQQLRVQLATQKHEKGKAKGESKVKVLAELTKLRQVALDPNLLYENVEGGSAKTGAVLELIDEAVAAGKKVLVFSQFTSYLRRLATQLEERGLAYYRITGATPKKQRVQLVDAFNEDDTPVFLVSLKAGGTGLNLTGASVVIHADPWWNAAATNQATDRAHRLGQKNKVSVYKVIAKGTIEERILKLQQAKSDLADAVVGEGGGLSLATLTPDELLALLSDED